MPETAVSLPPSSGEEEKTNFLFVSLAGERPHPADRRARKQIRTHVMRNYLETHEALDQVPKPIGFAPPASQEMKFKLKDNKLEEAIPYRQRRKPREPNEKDLPKQKKPSPEDAFITTFSVQRSPEKQSSSAFEEKPLLPTEADITSWSRAQRPTVAKRNPYDDVDDSEASLRYTSLNTDVAMPTAPLRWFGESRIDPLSVLPFKLSRFDEMLLDRFRHYQSQSWCPIGGQSAWFGVSITDETLFHATMYNYMMHVVSSAQDIPEQYPNIVEHKLAAIHSINERLSNPVAAIEDNNLAAVVAIVNAEVTFGSAEDATKHMTGLSALVDMRGGIENLGSGIGGLLQRVIGWTDLNYAELWGQPLKFRARCDWDRARSGWSEVGPCFWEELGSIPAAAPRVRQPLQGRMISLLHEIRQLCDEVAKVSFLELTEPEKMTRSDKFHSIERKLRITAEAPPADVSGPAETEEDMVWRACASAGLLYVHHMLRALPLGYHQFNTLCQELQVAMRRISNAIQAWSFAPEILLWALSVGTIIATGRPQHDWFAGSLAEASRAFGYLEWHSFRDAVQSFLWVEGLDEERYHRVWQDSRDVSFMTAMA